MASNNMNVFTSDINNLPDLAKSYLFQAVICPETGTALADMFSSIGTEQFILRLKKISIPKKTFSSPLETNYMGSKKTYPGRAEMNGSCSVEFDEFQDLLTSKMLHIWQGLLYNHTINEDGGDIIGTGTTGGANSNYLRQYTGKIYIYLYDSTLKQKLPYYWVLYQCWPNEVNEVSLDQAGSEKIVRSCTFNYNTFQMINGEQTT